MGQKKTFLNNLWKKNYSINKIFFEDINKKKFLKYLKKQKYIDYNLINKNFSLIYDKKFPIAFLLKNKKKIVGFLGTLFSIRKINKKKFIFCNIHSWLVDVPHRIAADLLFKDDYAMVAIFHSHLVADEKESEFDIKMSDNCCQAFLIYSLNTKKINIYSPQNLEGDVNILERFKEIV